MRVLILADDCNPEWPSLPIVGYKAARAIAKYADVVVATHIRNRENIEKHGYQNIIFRYIDNEYIARPMYAFAKLLRRGTDAGWSTAMALAYPSYLGFEREVWKVFRREIESGEYDLIHRLTPMSPTLPSPIAKWSPIPFVLGPLNGGLQWPPAFREELDREREWLSYFRNVYRYLPFHSSTYRKSAAVLAAFNHTINDLPKFVQKSAINFPEVGIDPEIFDQVVDRPVSKKKTILFAGRLVPYKLPQIIVKAFRDQPALHAHRLVLVGDGPERPAIEELIRNGGLAGRVELLGWRTQAEVAEIMKKADIFAFPSIRELGAGVVVEAMACGMACVVVDYGGPGTLISEERGIKVPLGNREELATRFGLALTRLVSDNHTTLRLGSAARQHVRSLYSWEAKAQKIISVYEWVLGRGPRPEFWEVPAAVIDDVIDNRK
jgi:glycosyltransferase involved in cell wall biosynthesis